MSTTHQSSSFLHNQFQYTTAIWHCIEVQKEPRETDLQAQLNAIFESRIVQNHVMHKWKPNAIAIVSL